MNTALGRLRTELLRFARLVYLYSPIPPRWKDGLVFLAYRVAGGLFEGQRHHDLWRLRNENAVAPPPVPHRASGRPRILVVDRYIPQPDRDAGSRSMWCVMRAMVQMGLDVTFWPQDLLYDPVHAPPLQALGIEIIHGDAFRHRFDEWIARHGAQIDHAFVSRPLVASEFLPALRKHSRAKVIYYGHDLHHERLLQEFEFTGIRALRWEAATLRKLEQSLWRRADAVYYPSATETATVLNTVPGATARTLPLYFFDDAPPGPVVPDGRAGVVFVAGFGHGPNVDAARWLVQAIMPLVWARRPHVHLWLVGSNPGAEVRGLAGDDVTVTGYVPDERLLEHYRTARVAIVPLRIGAGVKGKVIEALHHGVPLVTTPVGVQGLAGLEAIIPVSDDAEVLARELAALLEQDDRWRAVSANSLRYAAEQFSARAMERVLRLDIEVPAAAPH